MLYTPLRFQEVCTLEAIIKGDIDSSIKGDIDSSGFESLCRS